MRRVLAKPVFRPLIGFGPWGWALLPVALALSACVVMGVDVRHQIINLVNTCVGEEGMYLLVTRILVGQSLAMWDPIPSPVMLTWLLPALFLQPGRVPRWAWVAVVLVGLCLPSAVWECYIALFRTYSPTGAPVWEVARSATCLSLPWLCLWVTQSRWLSATLLVATLPSAAWHWVVWSGVPLASVPAALGWLAWPFTSAQQPVWHILTAGIFIGGAIAARRQAAALRPYMCGTCVYDRRGLADTALCPECGSARAHGETPVAIAQSSQ